MMISKKTKWTGLSLLMALLTTWLWVSGLMADEGMWTFDNVPLKTLEERYSFMPTQEWLDHVRLSSVRFMNGGSGSFVSPNGLVMTNHHVAVGQLQNVSTEQINYVKTGFYAATPEQEIKSQGLQVNVLMSMEDVTDQVLSAVKPGMSDEEALKARQLKIAEIENESLEQTGLRPQVVNLYHGGEYWLYRYKEYDDVRLVFAPERQAAYFGGDDDNFTYPRYDLDVAFFRVYEDGKPINSKDYLRWNDQGAREDELVFVSGNPGSTDRLDTYAQLEFLRKYNYPIVLNYLAERIETLQNYARRGAEQARQAQVTLFFLDNSKKALTGEYQGLQNAGLMAKRKAQEDEFREKIASNPQWQKQYGNPWQTVDEVTKVEARVAAKDFFSKIRGSRLADLATMIVRYVTEINKPDAERLEGYHAADLPQVKHKILSPAPIYVDLEQVIVAGTLQMSLDTLGRDDPFIKTVLGTQTPAEAAKALFSGTRLADVAYRDSLLTGGEKAVEKSQDPLIVMARKLDPFLREQEKWYRDHVESVLTAATEKIAQARFAVYDGHVYPDATFTLRLSFGTVKGYPMNGTIAPAKTTLYGLYGRSLDFNQSGPFVLPPRFWQRQKLLNLATPANFVSTCDIIGGNSGSPVINKDAELVGLIFDGNIESLVGRFIYNEETGRAVAVHSSYIMEALRHLYNAGPLADEIEGMGSY